MPIATNTIKDYRLRRTALVTALTLSPVLFPALILWEIAERGWKFLAEEVWRELKSLPREITAQWKKDYRR